MVVTGLPGAGRSTLAVPLATALDETLLAQDAVTEVLFASLGVRDHAWTRELSRAAFDVVLSLAAAAPRAVLDAWWPAGRGERSRGWTGPVVDTTGPPDAEAVAARVRHALATG